jgi:signal transduction histidine kinase
MFERLKTKVIVARTSDGDVMASLLPGAFLVFHALHLVQVASILLAPELRSVGVGRIVGFSALVAWFLVAFGSAVRRGTIPVAFGLASAVTTTAFMFAVIPSMSIEAWKLHGTWLGIAIADCLICYSVTEQRRVRIALMAATAFVSYTIAVSQVGGSSLLSSPQFISTASNIPAVVVALSGIARITRSAIVARAEAEAALSVARERNRLHRVIHDSALQPLEALAGGWDVEIDAVRDNARRQAILLRTALRAEAGLDELFLSDRLKSLALEWNARGLEVNCDLRADDTLLAPTTANAIAAASGEALANVAKHAGVMVVEMSSWVRSNRLYVRVQDRGRGFDPEIAAGFGITKSIRERMTEVRGTVEVRSAIGQGTSVILAVPC